MRQFVAEHPETELEWFKHSNYIACLSVKSERELEYLLDRAQSSGILCSQFREPDLNDQLTAIALAPGETSKKLCKSIRLVLSG